MFWLGWIVIRSVAVVVFRIRIMDNRNIPAEGPFILACNHISYYDPPLVGASSPRLVHFMAKKELFRNRLFGWLISATKAHPINRRGFDRKAIEITTGILKSGQGLTIFPEGTRSQSDSFLSPHPGVGLLARRNMVPVVPVYINGANRLKECFLGRNRLGTIFGRPIGTDKIAEFSDDREGYRNLAVYIMERIGELKKEFLDRNGLTPEPVH
nr:1-acyl-sn-glycerol-3-phosphate acyltransferase [candidate division Zixibacteria bacterium]